MALEIKKRQQKNSLITIWLKAQNPQDIMVYADGLQETISQRAQGSRQGISLGSTHAMSDADHAGVAKISFRPSELPRGFDQHLPDESWSGSQIMFDTGRLQPRSLQKFGNSAEESSRLEKK